MGPDAADPNPERIDLAALPREEPDRVHRYGEHDDQVVDLFLPQRAEPAPVVVLVHGGCWMQTWDRSYFGAAARALSRRGFAVANLEYRRLPGTPGGAGDGGWPRSFQDVADGLDSLADVDAPLDLERVVAVGHSAGGHLAQWLSTRAYMPSSAPGCAPARVNLRGVLVLAGIPDLARAVDLGVCGDAAVRLLGATPDDDPERYRLASPSAQPESGVEVVHIVGADDDLVPASYLQGCVLHGPLRVLPACDHHDPVVPTTAAWTAVVDQLEVWRS